MLCVGGQQIPTPAWVSQPLPLCFSSSSSGALFALLWLHPAGGTSAAPGGPPPRVGPASLSVGFVLGQQSSDRPWCGGCCYGLSSSLACPQHWGMALAAVPACRDILGASRRSFHGDGQGSVLPPFPFRNTLYNPHAKCHIFVPPGACWFPAGSGNVAAAWAVPHSHLAREGCGELRALLGSAVLTPGN